MKIDLNAIIKYQLIILVGILIILEGFLIYQEINLVNKYLNSNLSIQSNDSLPADEQDLSRRRIDGQEVAENLINLFPVAINIDNHFDSWPNFGLSAASVVYEAPVEGSATRFLAIYTPDIKSEEVSKIGPVRSTRPYFVEIAHEYGAMLAHSGGSAEGLRRIEELEVPNLEEIAWWGPDYFWRVYSRAVPHNLFSSSLNLAKGVVDWELAEEVPTYRPWQFSDELKASELKRADEIIIDLSPAPAYDVSYIYSSSTDSYLRFQGEEEHLDGLTNKQIGVNNVVVQFVPEKKVLDSEGRIELNLIGSGQALIFRDGIVIEGSWKKLSYESRTIFYDSYEREVEFKPGNIWIEILPGNRVVDIY